MRKRKHGDGSLDVVYTQSSFLLELRSELCRLVQENWSASSYLDVYQRTEQWPLSSTPEPSPASS